MNWKPDWPCTIKTLNIRSNRQAITHLNNWSEMQFQRSVTTKPRGEHRPNKKTKENPRAKIENKEIVTYAWSEERARRQTHVLSKTTWVRNHEDKDERGKTRSLSRGNRYSRRSNKDGKDVSKRKVQKGTRPSVLNSSHHSKKYQRETCTDPSCDCWHPVEGLNDKCMQTTITTRIR